MQNLIVSTLPPTWDGMQYVCLSVSPLAYFKNNMSKLATFFVHVTFGRRLVFL